MELKGDIIHAYLRGITAERSGMQQQCKEDPSVSKIRSKMDPSAAEPTG